MQLNYARLSLLNRFVDFLSDAVAARKKDGLI
jgi:hypothetical protein